MINVYIANRNPTLKVKRIPKTKNTNLVSVWVNGSKCRSSEGYLCGVKNLAQAQTQPSYLIIRLKIPTPPHIRNKEVNQSPK